MKALFVIMILMAPVVHAAVIEVPTIQSTVAIEFASGCKSPSLISDPLPGNESSTPGNAQVDGVLALTKQMDCSKNGTIIGTRQPIALGSTATLEMDAEALTSYPINFARNVGVLQKGTKIRILSYGGTYHRGTIYAIVQVIK